MIAFLEGIVEEATPLEVVLNVSGVGYRIHIPVTTAEKIPPHGSKVRLHTHAVYREDSQALYGFIDRNDRAFFILLTEKVSGVGPRIALSILSRLSVPVLREAILAQDVSLLSKCPGIGKKTAERLCIELRDHVGSSATGTSGSSATFNSHTSTPGTVSDALSALMALGYKLDIAEKSVRKAREKLGAEATTEDLIREALR